MFIVLFILMFIFLAAIIGWFAVTSYLLDKYQKNNPPFLKEYDYTEDDFISVLKAVFVNYWVHNRKLLIEMRYRERICVLDPKREARHEIVRTEYWTDAQKSDIHLDGFKRVRGMHDSLLWLFVPVYMKIDNARFFEVPDTMTDGKYDYPQDTGETLHDYASSNATQRFIAAMAKTGLDNMDTHTIIMLIILIIGAVFGLHLFGVF